MHVHISSHCLNSNCASGFCIKWWQNFNFAFKPECYEKCTHDDDNEKKDFVFLMSLRRLPYICLCCQWSCFLAKVSATIRGKTMEASATT